MRELRGRIVGNNDELNRLPGLWRYVNHRTDRWLRVVLFLQDLCVLPMFGLGCFLLWIAFRMSNTAGAGVAVAWLSGYAVLSLLWSVAILIANHFTWRGSERGMAALRYLTWIGIVLFLLAGPLLLISLPWLLVVLVPTGLANIVVGFLVLLRLRCADQHEAEP